MSSNWRLELGRHIGATYAQVPAVAAALVAGSAARGHADRSSDIELFVAWSRPPTDEERDGVASAVAADHRLIDFNDDWECWDCSSAEPPPMPQTAA